MSTKSDCGVGGGGSDGSVSNTRRNWGSESQLEQRDQQSGAGRLQAPGHKPFKALSLNTLLKVSFLSQNNKNNKNILSRSWAWQGRG